MSKRVLGGDKEYHGREVLDQWELAEDLGWLLPTNRPVPIDPALVDEVVALQEKRAS